jgi:DNA-binding NarL/FixJ family response regulator
MLTDIVRTIIDSQDDFELAGEVVGNADVAHAADEAAADVVILGLSVKGGEANCVKVLYTRPYIKVVAIEPDGRRAMLHELQPSVVSLGEISPETLIAAVRHRCGPVKPERMQ